MSEDLTKITKPIDNIAETVESEVPQPTITEEHPSPLPKIRRKGFKARDYDNQRGGMTSESGRFKTS
jgi:hypothetical protein